RPSFPTRRSSDLGSLSAVLPPTTTSRPVSELSLQSHRQKSRPSRAFFYLGPHFRAYPFLVTMLVGRSGPWAMRFRVAATSVCEAIRPRNPSASRSEERRVGKECRGAWARE